MLIKRFRAKSIQEALQIVRENLGPDACVLETREVRAGLIGRRLIEVEASSMPVAQSEEAATEERAAAGDRSGGKQLQTPGFNDSDATASIASQLLSKELAETGSISGSSSPVGPWNTRSDSIDSLESAHSRSVNRLHTRLTPVARELLEQLIAQEVDPLLASRVVNEAVGQCAEECRSDRSLLQGLISQLVANRLTVSATKTPMEHEQRILAMVGPNGVGKTTLLGKIAAQLNRESDVQIGIVAMDTWRNESVERLLELAEAVDAQVEVIDSNSQLPKALQRLRETDVVFIDTPGRSPSDANQMATLQETLAVAQPDETHLVLAAGTSSSALRSSIDRFREVGADHLAICKTEETNCLGQWIAPLVESGLPMRYVSGGLELDSPLAVTSARHLASLLLGLVKNEFSH